MLIGQRGYSGHEKLCLVRLWSIRNQGVCGACCCTKVAGYRKIFKLRQACRWVEICCCSLRQEQEMRNVVGEVTNPLPNLHPPHPSTFPGAHFHLDWNRTNVLDNTNSIGHLSWKPNNNRTFLSCSLEQRVLNGKFSAVTENNTQSNSSTVHTGLKSN